MASHITSKFLLLTDFFFNLLEGQKQERSRGTKLPSTNAYSAQSWAKAEARSQELNQDSHLDGRDKVLMPSLQIVLFWGFILEVLFRSQGF